MGVHHQRLGNHLKGKIFMSEILNLGTLNKVSEKSSKLFFDDVDLDVITQDNYRQIDPNFVHTLIDNFKEVGVQTPISVKIYLGKNGRKVVLADGNHRLEAIKALRKNGVAKHLASIQLPATAEVVSTDSIDENEFRSQNLVTGITSNNIRRGDTVWERGKGIHRLRAEGRTTAQIANIYGVDRKTIERLSHIGELPDSLTQRVRSLSGKLKDGEVLLIAKEYLKIRNKKLESLNQDVVSEQTENDIEKELLDFVRNMQSPVKTTKVAKSPLLDKIATKIIGEKHLTKESLIKILSDYKISRA
jgi:ParB-like nuclease domain